MQLIYLLLLQRYCIFKIRYVTFVGLKYLIIVLFTFSPVLGQCFWLEENTFFSQTCAITLSGHVEDKDIKEMLPGAIVTLKETHASYVTDDKGDFIFTGLCPGKYTLQVTHVACDTLERTVTLTKDLHIDIYMPHAMKMLGTVTIETKKGIPDTGYKKELTSKQMEEVKGLSLAEALSKLNGVTMLQTGSVIAKPVIHGLHGSRILTINNGVRQEGQQWGNEHASEIDPLIADKLVVIKGVDELRYGSDAIAGVILVQPKALRNAAGHSGEINTAYFTNNRQYMVSGIWEQQFKKLPAFTYRLQGTFKKGANAATPDYRLNNTGSEEKNFSATAAYWKEKFNTNLYYSVFNTRVGIFTGSHIGNLTDLQNAINATKPDDVFLGQKTYSIRRPYQDVTHHLLKSQSVLWKGDHKFSLLLAGQFNDRKEFDIVRSSSNSQPQMHLSVATFTEDLNWEHPKTNGFSGVAGVALMQQDNSYSGRYFIPNYTSYTNGGYYIEKWSRHKWDFQAGIRYDHKTISTTRLKFNSDTISHDFNFSTLAASGNIIYNASENWHFNVNASRASRAPYVNELLSDGIHHGTATYEKGDINLKAERSTNISTGINYQNNARTLVIDVLLYSNTIHNFIYRKPVPDSPVLTITGAFPLIKYGQTDAWLSGADIAASWKILPALQWETKLSVLNAKDVTQKDWLILMPANRISNEITYRFKNTGHLSNSYISCEMQNVMQQKHIPDESQGKQDYKAPPPAYFLLNLNLATTVAVGKSAITLGIGVHNLLNARYRDYLNSMRYFTDETGRNVGIRVKIPVTQP